MVSTCVLTEGNLFEDCVAAMNSPMEFAAGTDFGKLAKLALTLLVLSGAAFAQQQDLTQLSLEDLMNTKVTSVSKKEQSLSRTAAAIFVITTADIRRSGATNIPDLLRMVPGLDVAQINANSWAVSARGFNHQFSDKLLVLIDGRAVYTPLFAGVYWDTQDVPLEDIERIEVIRGPGATVWGANAVNGVINIITKSAAETQGGLLIAGGGTQDLALGMAQYGGKIGKDASYRVFAKYLDQNHLPNLTGQNGEDRWHLSHVGFRTDASLSQKDSLTVEGDLYGGTEGANFGHIVSIAPPVNENVNGSEKIPGGDILSRWNHVFSSRSDTRLQFYFDRYERDGQELSENRDTFDLDFQHHLALGARHDLIWGVDYRHSSDFTVGTIDQAWVPAGGALQLFSTFAQDEIVLKPDRVFLTVGTKLENNYYAAGTLTRASVWPGLRVSSIHSGPRFHEPIVVHPAAMRMRTSTSPHFPGRAGCRLCSLFLGIPRRSRNTLWLMRQATEHNLRARFPLMWRHSSTATPIWRRQNQVRHSWWSTPLLLTWSFRWCGATRCMERLTASRFPANWKVNDRWTLSPGYALLQMHLHTDPTSQDTTSVTDTEGSSPRHQAQLRSHLNLPGRFVWDASGYFVERLPAQAVPSYTRIDTQLSRQLGERLEFSLVGQNLLQDHHLESNDMLTSVNPTQVKRSAYAKITWRFW